MASDTHIKFEGVEGESQPMSRHKGWIEVLSWSLGCRCGQPASARSRGGGFDLRGQARVAADITFTHQYDKASPVLAKKSRHPGIHFPTVTLVTGRKTGDMARRTT